jgi:hypothetical protein
VERRYDLTRDQRLGARDDEHRKQQRRRLRLLRYAAAAGHRQLPAAIALCVALSGCANGSRHAIGTSSARVTLQRYITQIEPIRLAVNRLLERADPVLAAFHAGDITATAAAARMAALERRFALFTVDIAAIHPATPALRVLHSAYAETYVLEDAYLNSLVAGLHSGTFGDLPDTQAAQRAAITRWRVGLEVLARDARVPLPPDLQHAGRGEIAPSPTGS